MANKKPIQLRGKQLPWLSHYLDREGPVFLNATGAARLAGYKDDVEGTCSIIGHENLRKLKPLIEKWMEDEGFSEEALKRKHLGLLDARTTKFAVHEGKITDKLEIADNSTQVKALDMAYRIKGSYAADKIELSGLDELANRLAAAHRRSTTDDAD